MRMGLMRNGELRATIFILPKRQVTMLLDRAGSNSPVGSKTHVVRTLGL